jgi:hypothetical protein
VPVENGCTSARSRGDERDREVLEAGVASRGAVITGRRTYEDSVALVEQRRADGSGAHAGFRVDAPDPRRRTGVGCLHLD